MLRFNNKRGQLGGFVTLFWAIVVVFVIMLIFVFSFSLLNAFSTEKYGTRSVDVSLIGNYMKQYESNVAGVFRCEVDLSTCQVLDTPCACPSGGALENADLPYDVCSSGDFCYYGEKGCSNEGGSIAAADLCEKSLGKSFVSSKICTVDPSTCQVLDFPCTCPTGDDLFKEKFGKVVAFPVCFEGDFCYYGINGCEKDSASSRSADLCLRSLGKSFVPAQRCEVDSDNKVINFPCTCPSGGLLSDERSGKVVAFPVCFEGDFCYYGEKGCSES